MTINKVKEKSLVFICVSFTLLTQSLDESIPVPSFRCSAFYFFLKTMFLNNLKPQIEAVKALVRYFVKHILYKANIF